ncbi:hypothetical protein B0T10DRAFT_608402 [Thelonectria olida]|uniref:Infection structure specific protein n=1 Tax=Thelonectria olida TaxID=1576542 RepID=A0A9P8VYZ8_9HYPO|nr:hypothetical protein B0T10DRAFT_608402 [Thelonectria olida]
MHSLFILSGPVALAHQVLANDIGPNALGMSPAFPPNGAPVQLERRDLDQSCARSVISSLALPLPTNSDFVDWASSSEEFWTESCTITVPSSFSSDYISYASALDSWLDTIESAAAEATDCGADDDDKFYITFSELCTGSRTVVFTGSASGTAAPTGSSGGSTTVLEPLDMPEETIKIGAASQHRPVVSVAIALFTVLAFALAL